MTPNQLANKWIKELTEAGFTPEQMLDIFKMAKEKYKYMKEKELLNTIKIIIIKNLKGDITDRVNVGELKLTENTLIITEKLEK